MNIQDAVLTSLNIQKLFFSKKNENDYFAKDDPNQGYLAIYLIIIKRIV